MSLEDHHHTNHSAPLVRNGRMFSAALFLVIVPYAMAAISVARDYLCDVVLPDEWGMKFVGVQIVWILVGGSIASFLVLIDSCRAIWLFRLPVLNHVTVRSAAVIVSFILVLPLEYYACAVLGSPSKDIHDAIRRDRNWEIPPLLRGDSSLVKQHFESGRTILHECWSAKAAYLVISSGADVNARDDFGNSPLHYAVARHDADPFLISELVSAGASVDAINADGDTPLHVAVARCRSNVAVLVDLGASLRLTNHSGQTPRDVALALRGKLDGSDAVDLEDAIRRLTPAEEDSKTETRVNANLGH